jgi:eukaryotic-like serine/threonine-protein kinase
MEMEDLWCMNHGSNEASPIKVFYSCADAKEDTILLDKLEKHLSPLCHQGIISTWHYRNIEPGSKPEQENRLHLDSSSIILLLISSHFLGSERCYGFEMPRALEREKNGEAYVIAVLLRPVDWQCTPFAHLHCLPRNHQPVTRWRNRDAAFAEIVQAIRTEVETRHGGVRKSRPASVKQTTGTATSLEEQNRQRFLKRVRDTWTSGVLKRSLYNDTLITLGLHEQPGAVANPWRPIVQETDGPALQLSDDPHITQVYGDAYGLLLILGEPGAGKTTLLLELACDLLKHAEQDQTHPIPVVFHLSSWAEKRLPFAAWLVKELKKKYKVPEKVGKAWVNDDKLILLLDGLDEVAELYRSDCIKAINAYRDEEEHAVAMVVCSRSREYRKQTALLGLQSAVEILPLTDPQIYNYLEEAGEKGLQVVLRGDSEVKNLVKTPLMLSVLARTYSGKSAEDIINSGSLTEQKIFEAYVQSIFARRSKNPYEREQTIYWLTWLAKQMRKREEQAQFYLEQLQIDWLPKSRQGQFYTCLACGLLIFLGNTCINALLYSSLLNGSLIGLWNAAIFLLLNGLLFASNREEKRQRLSDNRGSDTLDWFLGKGIDVGYGLLSGLLDAIFVGFLIGPSYGLLNGSICGLFFLLLRPLDTQIQSQEILLKVWSWTSFWLNFRIRLIGGVGIGCVFALADFFRLRFNLSLLLPLLVFGLFIGLAIGFVIALLGGFSEDEFKLDPENVTKPNQGTWNAFSNSTRLAFILGLASGLIFYIFYSFIRFKVGYTQPLRLKNGLLYGISDGLTIAILSWPISGGLTCIRHFILRILLWQAGCMPWNYPRFLDYAYERILLQKVGGGYSFIHKLLQEYFADLKSEHITE